MCKLLKLVLINVLVFIEILFFLNFAAILTYQAYQGYKIIKPRESAKGNNKCGLPNYKNVEWARKHFEEEEDISTEYRSYIGWRRLPYKGQTINIDEQGIRNTPQSELVTEASPLVVFLGGSTMWGSGADDRNTIPALFAEIAKGRYRTMNLGETSYNAFQGYLFLKLQIMNGLCPNIVVSYDGVNDAFSCQHELRPFSHNREYQIRTVMKGQDRKNEDILSFNHFFLKPLESFIFKFKAKYRYNNEKKSNYDFSHERTEQVAKALLESWLSTKELAERHGASFVAILQPNAAVGKPYLEHLKLDADILKLFNRFYSVVLKLLQSPRYRELSNSVIVLTDVFDQEECIYIDHCHVSPNGNKIVAREIYSYINNSVGNNKKKWNF